MITDPTKQISDRKKEHISICLNSHVEYTHKTTWFEYVEFVSHSLPLIAESEINTCVKFLGKKISFPFIIGAMTGGCDEGSRINRDLAAIAQSQNIGLALGSQRAMLKDKEIKKTYLVRDISPDILLLANIGIAQAVKMKAKEIVNLIDEISADGICLHLNTAMEYMQPEGETNIFGVQNMIRDLAEVLGPKLIVKETGCGISKEVAEILFSWGVQVIDVSGSGGTSWICIENKRGDFAGPIKDFENWSIPTAASLLEVSSLPIKLIASGGIRSGIDLAKSIALGADYGSSALTVLRALKNRDPISAEKLILEILYGLRFVMLLTNSRSINELKQAKKVILGPLYDWHRQRL